MTKPWIGRAAQIDDYDLPRIGYMIGVGEDIVHMVMDVESRGEGFNDNGVIRLFEKHKMYKYVPKDLRDAAVNKGIAYPKWRRDYKNNEAFFLKAYEFDPKAALLSTSWGLGQIMGFNYKLAGYSSVEEMVKAFADDEAEQLEAMIKFITNAKLDSVLQKMEKTTDKNELVALARIFAKGYNGEGYAKNDYHNRLVNRLIFWRGKPDTPWSPEMAKIEEHEHDMIVEANEPAIIIVSDRAVGEQLQETVSKKKPTLGSILMDILKKIFGIS